MASQVEAFERDGFVVVPQLFDQEEMRRISAWTDELQRLPEVPGRCMMYFGPSILCPKERILQRIENFCPFHAGFAALCDGDKLRGFASRLFGEPAMLFKDKINFKLPGGDGFKPHQDQQAGWTVYAALFITAMVSLDSTTEENGCLELCAGQHTRGPYNRLSAGDHRARYYADKRKSFPPDIEREPGRTYTFRV